MDLTATMEAPCDPSALFAWVDDLSRYPQWLGIVARAEPSAAGDVDDDASDDDDGPPAWQVDLRAHVGPLSRSKRLRMVRVLHRPPEAVRFERRELDGRRHAPWVLDAEVCADGETGSRLVMKLHYGGALWIPALERLLGDEIRRSRSRLLDRVTAA